MTLTIRTTGLPVEDSLPEIIEAMSKSPSAILKAAPGAGKTSLVPLHLLNEVISHDQKILMLEPRRLAARASAHRMADLIGETVGETAGYRVRLDSKISPKTRIEVVTEGILTRRLQADPELKGVGMIIFDEFHERSLQTDLGLALSLEVQEGLREDLKILLMSATLDTNKLSNLLRGAPVIESEGRQFPVETRYLPQKPNSRIDRFVADAVMSALRQDPGDVLVFLPGAGEINRVQENLKSLKNDQDILILPLFGNLGLKDQNRAIQPDPQGRRKVVLSTDIAETSLTIEGVHIVVDAGLSRAPRFDPNSGMSRLETSRVSKASADQRRGRAGRLGPGICYRLWAEPLNHGLSEFTSPEIMVTDLSGLVLELAAWGAHNPDDLVWMTRPPEGHMSQARDLLKILGALDQQFRITALGKEMAKLPLHPRLACMVLKSREMKAEFLGCSIAAILSERDLIGRDRENPNSNLLDRVELLSSPGNSGSRNRSGVNITQLRRLAQIRDDLMRRIGARSKSMSVNLSGTLLAFAYPDRIGELRKGSQVQYRLTGGRGARLLENDRLSSEPYIVVADLDGKDREAIIHLAAPIAFKDLVSAFKEAFREDDRVYWDDKKQRVLSVTEKKLGALVLDQKKQLDPDPDEVLAVLVKTLGEEGLGFLSWGDDSLSLLARLKFARHHGTTEDWPDYSETALLENLEHWLGPYLSGISSLSEIKALKIHPILEAGLSHAQKKELSRFAPVTIEVPSGSKVRLDYTDPEMPVLAVRLQEVFGLENVPKLAGGRIPVSIHLLSPARRPLQITSDLAGFWRTSYHDVKKDMKGRYPKHYWPDDPLQAEPTSRAKPRKK
ncbi:MAG: ATP-dependent helicase HrpB [Proteobacteria bacterium]|nr:ATP-dependent helicase HrpB [Pseudomonadota bacterium]